MNVYDFDNTIYDGESIFDFYLFSVKKQPRLLKYLFIVLKTLIRYRFFSVPTRELEQTAKKYAQQYLSELEDKERLVKSFWDKNEKKIKPFYLENRRDDDVILSASVDFLLEEILSRVGKCELISSSVNKDTGEVLRVCYRKNKVALFRAKHPLAEIENFYTDSFSDADMLALAHHAYLVEGSSIRKVGDAEKEKIIKKYSEKTNNS